MYFRSLHLGNVVVTPDQRLGLIDVADMLDRVARENMRVSRDVQIDIEAADDLEVVARIDDGDAITRDTLAGADVAGHAAASAGKDPA